MNWIFRQVTGIINARMDKPEIIDNRTRERGIWGERTAERFLRDAGYRIIGRNVRYDHRGEADLIVRDDDHLVFVEVKTRATEDYGRPVDAVDAVKRRSLGRLAIRFLLRAGFPPLIYRFDVIEVVGIPGHASPVVRHLENVFQLSKRYQIPY